MDQHDDHQEKLLTLTVATNVSSDYSSLATNTSSHHIQRKRNKITKTPFPTASTANVDNLESKATRLLKTREKMLKRDRGHHTGKSSGPHLIRLLLLAATSAGGATMDHLTEVYAAGASRAGGDPAQRVAAYFADALAARLLLSRRLSFSCAAAAPDPAEEFSAAVALCRASPFFQFSHFTANQAILEAFERRGGSAATSSLHVIDFDVSYGFQWPSLIQSLAAAGGPRVSLRITGIGRSSDELRETEDRLRSFSRSFRNNLSFDFYAVSITDGSAVDSLFQTLIWLKLESKNESETSMLAVNLVLHGKSTRSLNPAAALRQFRALDPAVVVVVEREVFSPGRGFPARFADCVHYFAAMFESLEESFPAESAERVGIEKNLLGRQIAKAVLDDRSGFESWRERLAAEICGFRRVKMSSKCVMQAKLLLKMRATDNSNGRGGFRVFERDDGKALCLGWQNRSLLTASVYTIH